MTSKLRIRDTSGWSMFIFGALALLLGLVGLLRPEFLHLSSASPYRASRGRPYAGFYDRFVHGFI